jgi:hypothetical protein
MERSDSHKDENEHISGRLRSERPRLEPLELDRVRTTAFSRARRAGGRSLARRRLAVAGLTIGLMAAGTGGVIAAGGASHSAGNAATAQYGLGGVAGSTTHKKGTFNYRIHLHVPFNQTLTRVSVRLNGRLVLVLVGNKASSTVNVPLPCGTGLITLRAVTSSGQVLVEYRHLQPCVTVGSRKR